MTSQLILQNSCISSTLDEPSFLLFPGNQGNWNFFPKSCLFQSLKPASCNQIRNSVTRSRQQRNTKIKQKGDHSWKYTIFWRMDHEGVAQVSKTFSNLFALLLGLLWSYDITANFTVFLHQPDIISVFVTIFLEVKEVETYLQSAVYLKSCQTVSETSRNKMLRKWDKGWTWNAFFHRFPWTNYVSESLKY